MTKHKARREMLRKRAEMTASEVRDASDIIIRKIRELDSFKRAKTVLFYFPIKNEADLLPLMRECMHEKTICLPRAENRHGHMTARLFGRFDELEQDCHKVPSPPESAHQMTPDEIDFIAVPLAVYDDDLNRIGYGGGYYDRYLPLCTKAFKCGVAYSFQKVNGIKHDSHDVKLNAVVTEV